MLNDTRMMAKPHLLPLENEDDLLLYSSSSMSDKLSSTQNATMLSFDYNFAKETFLHSFIHEKCISGSTSYQLPAL